MRMHAMFVRAIFLCGVLLCCLLLGCADIRFEHSPYAIRGLDMVYSDQEDITFLVWRLRDSADPKLVSFELYQDGAYMPITLSDALYPAKPYECGAQYICFQYQLKGRYLPPKGVLPMRSIHASEGLYAGSEPRVHRTAQTFSALPFAIDRNHTIDPQLHDWFVQNKVPFKRDYQWQIVNSSRPEYRGGAVESCSSPASSSWAVLGSRLDVDYSWVEAPRCMAIRPKQRDDQGTIIEVPFIPSAELFSEQQDYLPQEERSPVIYAYLVDLLVRGESRCAMARSKIISAFDDVIGSRVPNATRLGAFTPLDPLTGQSTQGCRQKSNQDYPVRQILELLKTEAAKLAPQRARFVFVYMNNVDIPPSDRVLQQLLELEGEVATVPHMEMYTIAVGSNIVLNLLPWDRAVGWRPISDKTLLGDIEDWGESSLPFRTMLHTRETPVRINAPVGLVNPEFFKLCHATPDRLSQVVFGVGDVSLDPFAFLPWPESGVPHYMIDLEDQVLVPDFEYTRLKVSVVVEACARFCTFPFRTASGVDVDNWSQAPRRCQWSP